MNTNMLPSNHYLLSVTEDMQGICEILFKSSPINHFGYQRIYDDNSVFFLINNGELVKNHANIKRYPMTPYINKKMMDKSFYYLAIPNQQQFDQAIYDFSQMFGLYYPIYLFEIYEEYFDVYFFGCKYNDSAVINFYINNMEILENFKFYFKDKAAKIINKLEQDRLVIPPDMCSNVTLLKKELFCKKTLINELIPNRYQLNLNNNHSSISKREMETIRFLCHGYSVKEAAKLMKISPRTVEQYFNNLKIKLGLGRKSQIINFFLENNILGTHLLTRMH